MLLPRMASQSVFLKGEETPLALRLGTDLHVSWYILFKRWVLSYQASGFDWGLNPVWSRRRRTKPTMDSSTTASKRDGERVPARLEALVHPHVSSYDYFLSQGLHEALAHVEPVEVRVGRRRFGGVLCGGVCWPLLIRATAERDC